MANINTKQIYRYIVISIFAMFLGGGNAWGELTGPTFETEKGYYSDFNCQIDMAKISVSGEILYLV